MDELNKIAVLYGGTSLERDISLKSGEAVYRSILDLGYKSNLIDFKGLSSLNILKKYDFIFIALHGFEGEGGELQRKLDALNIPYSGSSYEACFNTWNKALTKEILRQKNLKTPNWRLIEDNYKLESLDEDSNLLPFKKHSDKEFSSTIINTFGKKGSVFLKPITDGSSLDIYKISSNKQFLESIKSSSDPNRIFMIEEAIEGREFTMTIIDEQCYPPIEIITKNQFYDYDAKYLSNETRLEKAVLNNEEMENIMEISLSAFKALKCRAWGRVDLMQNINGEFYIIEINTVPGMTNHSCVPRSGQFLGLSFNDVVKKIINASL
tara:strand:+ start:235 stop:1203 length:969 start_codon:yes stop_codon:yes gene_type:complete